ncbi:MAG TPA: sulfurtransferase [Chromatiaceae bacterium]|nr:sulfurtransferase [Chromatiaceae bacterium]
MREFPAAELNQYLANVETKPLLLDVREEWEFKLCRIDDAQLVPMRQIPEYLSQLDSQQEVVVICHHGIRSRHVGRYLEANGFERIINLSGGVAEWAKDVDPTMAVY